MDEAELQRNVLAVLKYFKALVLVTWCRFH